MLKRVAKRLAVAALIFTAFATGLLAMLVYGALQLVQMAVYGDDGDPSPWTFMAAFLTPSLFIGALVLVFFGVRTSRRARSRRNDAAAQAESWRRLYQRRDELLVRWSRYETDVALMIDYPVMTDYTDPVIRDVIVAMQGIRAAEAQALDLERGPAETSRLFSAVNRFETAFMTAERYARRCGQSKLSAAERSKLATARQALNIILDGAATPSEVDAAYRSLRGSLRGIIELPDQTVADLKAHTRAGLGMSPHGSTAAEAERAA